MQLQRDYQRETTTVYFSEEEAAEREAFVKNLPNYSLPYNTGRFPSDLIFFKFVTKHALLQVQRGEQLTEPIYKELQSRQQTHGTKYVEEIKANNYL